MARQLLRPTPVMLSIAVASIVLLLAAAPLVGQQGATGEEWPVRGGDQGGTRYSPLEQIDRENVADLEIRWTWRSDNFGTGPEYKNETTPIMAGGIVYFTAGNRRAVIAVDGATGETLWVWRTDEGERFTRAVRRNHRGGGVLGRRAGGTDLHSDARIPACGPGREDRPQSRELR